MREHTKYSQRKQSYIKLKFNKDWLILYLSLLVINLRWLKLMLRRLKQTKLWRAKIQVCLIHSLRLHRGKSSLKNQPLLNTQQDKTVHLVFMVIHRFKKHKLISGSHGHQIYLILLKQQMTPFSVKKEISKMILRTSRISLEYLKIILSQINSQWEMQLLLQISMLHIQFKLQCSFILIQVSERLSQRLQSGLLLTLKFLKFNNHVEPSNFVARH